MRTGTRLAAALLTIGTALASALVATTADAAGPRPARSDRPTVTKVEPASGPTAGGTVVTIKGDDLAKAKAVFFGAAKGVDLKVRSDRRLVVTTPAAAAGTVTVRVVAKGGTSKSGPTFTYVAPTTPPPPPPPPGTPGAGATTVPAPADAYAGNPGTSLTEVDCAATTPSATGLCRAVGSYRAGDGSASRPLLATRANDGSWTSVALPLPADAARAVDPRFTGLECFTGFPDTCIAVGTYTTTRGTQAALVVRRAGTTATAVSPSVAAAGDVSVVGLVCFADTYCQAAGNVGDRPLSLSWDGTTWTTTVLPLPSGATRGSVTDLACLYPGRCFAIGSWDGPAGERLLVEDGSGATWTAASPALPADAVTPGTASFSAITCVTGQQCHAVGSYYSQSGRRPLQAIQYGVRSGAFQAATATSAPSGADLEAQLTAVACGGLLDPAQTAPACVAAGPYRGGTAGPGVFATDVSRPAVGAVGPVPSVGTNTVLTEAGPLVCVARFVCGGLGNDSVVDGRSLSSRGFLYRVDGTRVEAVVAPTPTATWRSHVDDLDLLPGADGSPSSIALVVGSYTDGATRGLAVVVPVQ